MDLPVTSNIFPGRSTSFLIFLRLPASPCIVLNLFRCYGLVCVFVTFPASFCVSVIFFIFLHFMDLPVTSNIFPGRSMFLRASPGRCKSLRHVPWWSQYSSFPKYFRISHHFSYRCPPPYKS
jgi:hypothetical protein